MEKRARKILVVGATSRNLGKTGLVCSLIRRFSDHTVTFLKIKTLREGDQSFHGTGSYPEGNYSIREETGPEKFTDTARILEAGAGQVLYIRAKVIFLKAAFLEALEKIPENHLIIIESNSIVEVVKPAIYILILGPDRAKYKPSSVSTRASADLILHSDGTGYLENPDHLPLSVSAQGWELLPG